MTHPEVRTVDYHTGGEPFRLVVRPPFPIEGATVAERRMFAIGDPRVDGLRRMLCLEPRGHADMYGGFLTPPDDDGALLGVLFWHKDGFSTACGHGTIALGAWAVESGLVPPDPSGVTQVVIDVPSGRVRARVHQDGVDFVSVPSYPIARGVAVPTSRGEVTADIAYGGAIYAHVPAAAVGLTVEPAAIDQLIAIGREIKWALDDSALARHPDDDRLSGIYGTILYDDLGQDADGNPHQRNVTIFADGEVDRSPCGSGTASRVALLSATGQLRDNQQLVHDSIVGSRFHARVEQHVTVAGRDAVIPVVTGTAHKTGEHLFVVDPADPLFPGFVLR
ncbi:proline racemase family protein [Paractinoplanes lichenicola]|uniref:Proline racemase family protein n=1 Tax=Paractinoplanes lichenicola TaxID=2802976 RepID=A0ABS1VDK5_9ACTN|nr:proline racemase family protein [Actinoplanes lichenicola]MBL7252768.1 proline racemase family protein [Actinoplanes lichenicola]